MSDASQTTREQWVAALCCDTMRGATRQYSDAEGWGSMIWLADGKPQIASCLPEISQINFCPWCGHAWREPPQG